ncbi:MAG: hypothetical protein FWC79_02725 [Oscillospiraceae bacterium]|nr:hypothetical protein [Oscillospiraceae bacterium]
MKKTARIISRISSIIIIVLTLVAMIAVYEIYKTNDFNQFIRAEYHLGVSRFVRDREVTTGNGHRSYRIKSEEFNNAVFYRAVQVRPNTIYRVSALVKTENVESRDGRVNAGATISILGTSETSRAVMGTNDWQEVELIFNSRDRETVYIGFRLGGNRSHSRGTAWFSDFRLEEGKREVSTEWNVACFIFKNIEIGIEMNEYIEVGDVMPQGFDVPMQVSMRNSDVNVITENMTRFQKSAQVMSNNMMSVRYQIYEIDEPITSISYSEEFGYYIDPIDVKNLLAPYLEGKDYDHIFVVVRLGDTDIDIEIPVYDWIGLGRNGFI